MSEIFNRTNEKTKRQTLRVAMPNAEIILWSRLRDRQLKGFKFRRQYGVGKYVVDFYCPSVKLAIEIDGDSHFLESRVEEYDFQRQKYIESMEIKFLRFTNLEIYEKLEDVLVTIWDRLP
ncbi:MAG: endonuclease domain-containing protein [Candidatus Vogelbacteria bacterium]|nr:endonuclease domain-containing protein [Candidatus Vogelbacteria bacterium]